jgi:hypothetical protein
MAMPMMDMGDDMGAGLEDEAAPEAEMDEESQAAVEAFPELAGDPARIEALRTFVRLCAEKAMGGGYDEDEGPKEPGSLALVFGAEDKPKKK